MTFHLTTDVALIRSLLTEPRVYRRMVNDAAPSAERFGELVGNHPGMRYVVAEDSGTMLGLFVVQADLDYDAGADIHFCFVPEAWGRSVDVAQGFLKWLWSETHFQMAIGRIPEYNRLALKLAKQVGFVPYGCEVDAVTKHGKLYDLICTRIQRPKGAAKAA